MTPYKNELRNARLVLRSFFVTPPLENTLNDKSLRLVAFPSEFSTEAFFRGSGLLLNHPSKQIKDRVYAVWLIFK